MHTFRVDFFLNGKQQQEIVTARNETDAKELIMLRYKGERINGIYAHRVD